MLSFRLGGIPVRVEAAFFLVVVVLGLGRGGRGLAGLIAVVFVPVLVHELGHAVAFRAFGQTPSIRLWSFGGLTYGSAPLPPGKDIVVSLAGSAVQIAVLGLPAYLVTRTMTFTSLTTYLFWRDLVWVSLGWAVLNLLPLLPFDGGHVARTVLRRAMGERGEVAALWLSISVAALGAAWALVHRAVFLALYAVFFAGLSAQQLIERRDAPFREELEQALRRLEDDPDAAAATAQRVLGSARGGATLGAASEIVAWAALAGERDEEAHEAVRHLGLTARPTPVLDGCIAILLGDRERGLRQVAAGMSERAGSFPSTTAMRCIARADAVDELTSRLLARRDDAGPAAAAALALGVHQIGLYDDAIGIAERVFADGRASRPAVAYNAACSAARAGSVELAMRWLEAAVTNGFTDAAMLGNDDDLGSLRGTPAFEHLRASLTSAPTPS